jgi:hypothetical protein
MNQPPRQPDLAEAFARIARGNLIYGELAAWEALARDPDDADAWDLLGTACVSAGLIDRAVVCLRRAAQFAPERADIAHKRDVFEGALSRYDDMLRTARAGESFLLMKSWGYGFGSDLTVLLGQLMLCDLTGRVPVVHWGRNCLFGDGSDANAFGHFFAPLNDLTLVDMRPLAASSCYPGKWMADNLDQETVNKFQGAYARQGALYLLGRTERLVVSDFAIGIVDLMPWIPAGHGLSGKSVAEIYRALFEKYLRPVPAVRDRVARFRAARWPAGPVLAVHVREGDKKMEVVQLQDLNDAYPTRVDAWLGNHPDGGIFLLTDSEPVLVAFRGRYGDRVFSTAAQRTSDDSGIHYQSGTDRVQLGIELLSDILLALGADAFIGNGRSNPSCLIDVLKPWPADASHLLGDHLLLQRSWFLYDF